MPTYKGAGQFNNKPATRSEEWDETWGNPSYGYSKTGMTPSDVAEEQERRAAEHKAESEEND